MMITRGDKFQKYSGQLRGSKDWQISYRRFQCSAIFDYKVVTVDEETVIVNAKYADV